MLSYFDSESSCYLFIEKCTEIPMKSCHFHLCEGGRTQHLPWWPWLCSKRSGGTPGLPFALLQKMVSLTCYFSLEVFVGIVSWDCSWSEKTQRVRQQFVDSFLFLMCGSLCSLFFSGVLRHIISALISENRLDSSFPFHLGSPSQNPATSQWFYHVPALKIAGNRYFYTP